MPSTVPQCKQQKMKWPKGNIFNININTSLCSRLRKRKETMLTDEENLKKMLRDSEKIPQHLRSADVDHKQFVRSQDSRDDDFKDFRDFKNSTVRPER